MAWRGVAGGRQPRPRSRDGNLLGGMTRLRDRDREVERERERERERGTAQGGREGGSSVGCGLRMAVSDAARHGATFWSRL